MKKFVKENSLSLFFLVIFLLALVGQAIAGHNLYNEEAVAHGGDDQLLALPLLLQLRPGGDRELAVRVPPVHPLRAGHGLAAAEGSPESKELDKAGTESDKDQKVGRHAREDSPLWARVGGIRTTIYSNSLIIVMSLVFFGCWFAQSVTGWTDFNQEQSAHGDPHVSWLTYLGSSQFWESTLQNWQSEFLAVGSFAVLVIYLRQRGSPESKPVGAPIFDATGKEG